MSHSHGQRHSRELQYRGRYIGRGSRTKSGLTYARSAALHAADRRCHGMAGNTRTSGEFTKSAHLRAPAGFQANSPENTLARTESLLQLRDRARFGRGRPDGTRPRSGRTDRHVQTGRTVARRTVVDRRPVRANRGRLLQDCAAPRRRRGSAASVTGNVRGRPAQPSGPLTRVEPRIPSTNRSSSWAWPLAAASNSRATTPCCWRRPNHRLLRPQESKAPAAPPRATAARRTPTRAAALAGNEWQVVEGETLKSISQALFPAANAHSGAGSTPRPRQTPTCFGARPDRRTPRFRPARAYAWLTGATCREHWARICPRRASALRRHSANRHRGRCARPSQQRPRTGSASARCPRPTPICASNTRRRPIPQQQPQRGADRSFAPRTPATRKTSRADGDAARAGGEDREKRKRRSPP